MRTVHYRTGGSASPRIHNNRRFCFKRTRLSKYLNLPPLFLLIATGPGPPDDDVTVNANVNPSTSGEYRRPLSSLCVVVERSAVSCQAREQAWRTPSPNVDLVFIPSEEAFSPVAEPGVARVFFATESRAASLDAVLSSSHGGLYGWDRGWRCG